MTAKRPSRTTMRFIKQYPTDSLHTQQYAALKEYYGKVFDEVFFQTAWAVLGPLGSALHGASLSEVKKRQGAGKHLILALEAEAFTLASGDESGDFAAGPAFDGITAQFDEGTPDLDAWEDDEDNDDIPQATIPGDPFG